MYGLLPSINAHHQKSCKILAQICSKPLPTIWHENVQSIIDRCAYASSFALSPDDSKESGSWRTMSDNPIFNKMIILSRKCVSPGFTRNASPQELIWYRLKFFLQYRHVWTKDDPLWYLNHSFILILKTFWVSYEAVFRTLTFCNSRPLFIWLMRLA